MLDPLTASQPLLDFCGGGRSVRKFRYELSDGFRISFTYVSE
jgi:hypothetical protein